MSDVYVYPHSRTNDRVLAADYAGPVDVWDIDKTYLESEFERFRDHQDEASRAEVCA